MCEVNYENKKIFIVTLYRLPSQNDYELDEFLRSFENVTDNINRFNPYFLLIAGDFNARSSSWWGSDINNFEVISTENLTLSYDLKQVIPEPTHFLPTSSSCIDLISLIIPIWL